MKKTAFLFITEAGTLEQQAVMLAESSALHCPWVDVFSFSPRKGYQPAQQTISRLSELVTHCFFEDLNQKHASFPLANTLYAAAFFEQNHPEYGDIFLIDTDTVFTKPPDPDSFDASGVYVRPVDNKGVGTEGPHDPNESFWQSVFAYFKLPLPDFFVTTSIRQQRIRPYFNSGFTAAIDVPGFYTRWLADFDRLMDSHIRPAFIGRDGTNFGFFEQFSLSITLAREPYLLKPLPDNINYPIPFHPFLKKHNRAISLEKQSHVHYHKWFQHPDFLDYVFDDDEKAQPAFSWLKARLPFSPVLDCPLRRFD